MCQMVVCLWYRICLLVYFLPFAYLRVFGAFSFGMNTELDGMEGGTLSSPLAVILMRYKLLFLRRLLYKVET